MLHCTKGIGNGGSSSLDEQKSVADQKLFPLHNSLGLHFRLYFHLWGKAGQNAITNTHVKDSNLDTEGVSCADPVPLRELVEGLHYCEMQTQQTSVNGFCLV